MAEDDVQVRQMDADLLENAGYRVLAACDGEEAVRIFLRNADRIDLAGYGHAGKKRKGGV